MKKTLISMALMLATAGINAAPRTADQALLVAKKFMSTTKSLYGMQSSALTLAPTTSAQMAKSVNPSAKTPSYYVFNIDKGGFIIVSGDDRFKDVLGYSLQGSFSSDTELPDGLRYWLSFLSEEMNAAIEAGYEKNDFSSSSSTYNPANSVAPLLTSKWAQDKPFNNMLNGNMTGCVATGTAQVMRYWKYPTKGIGTHTGAYSPNFSADFASTTYDWNNMLDSYGTGWESKKEVDAVATLMLHIGVATDMRWGKTESATPNAYASFALIKYFGYNKNLYIENRDQMSLGAWKALLIDQLQTGHPLCYSGMSGNIGHFFVCDGYDAGTDKFHFNWGWEGAFDGYYDVTSLEPGTGGIGAGAGVYNYYQTIFVNMQPEEVGEPCVNFTCNSIKIAGTNKNNVAVSTLQLSNDNTGDIKGSIGLAVYDNAGDLVKYVPSSTNLPIANFHIGAAFSNEMTYTLSVADIPAGTYTVCPAAKSNDIEKPFRIRAKYDETNYYTMEVSATGVKFTPQAKSYDFSASSINLTSNADGDIFQNVVATFEVTVTNNSAQEFNDEIGVKISRSRGTSAIIAVPVTLAAGETKTVSVSRAIPSTLNVNNGYTAQPCYGVNGTYTTFGSTMTVNVKDEAAGINAVNTNNAFESPLYNIAGQRISKNAKGIVISNGKKIVKD